MDKVYHEEYYPYLWYSDHGMSGSEPSSKTPLFLGLGLLLFIMGMTALYTVLSSNDSLFPKITLPKLLLQQEKQTGIDTFSNPEEFNEYLMAAKEIQSNLNSISSFTGVGDRTFDFESTISAPLISNVRYSETNVQVKGIDEPDIVKTDGETLYFSNDAFPYFPEPFPLFEPRTDLETSSIAPDEFPESSSGGIEVIDVIPADSPQSLERINNSGEMLITETNLLVFDSTRPASVTSYDRTRNAQEVWTYSSDFNSEMVAARMYENSLYMVMRTNIDSVVSTCPITVFSERLTVPCTDIWRPNAPIPVNATYTIAKINTTNGTIEDSVSFVGSTGQSIVYMSPNAIYTTYTYYEDITEFMFRFLSDRGSDLIPSSALSEIANLQNIDISNRAKQVELELILQQHISSLPRDEQVRIQNEFSNRAQDYLKEHGRDLEQTGIIKTDIDSLSVVATGSVPGTPLNQFSLDEYMGNLRIATTVSTSGFGNAPSVNDVYVLSDNLVIEGEVLDLGVTERIYAVRFIEDKGYVVTFRQIDPFYVINLSDPKNPQMAGELKIPGFSSYLHPITKDLILGVGEENGNVKLSLFNVADPNNPVEQSKYLLDEFYSEVNSNHRAFLLDRVHDIFFIPAGRSGYIFSYDTGELALERVVSDLNAKRAVYINDYLYIIGSERMVVLDENTWTEEASISFR